MAANSTFLVKYSTNPKTNSVLNDIREQILSIHDTEEESIEELLHYSRVFPNEVDMNLYQYGNLLIYYKDIVEMFRRAGYMVERLSQYKWEETYKKMVGYVARKMVKEFKHKR